MTDDKGDKQTMKTDVILFDLILLAFFLLLAIMAFEYNPLARSIPLGLGIIGAAMTFLQLLVDAFPRMGPRLRFVSSSGILAGKTQFQPKNFDEHESNAEKELESEGVATPAEKRGGKQAGEWWHVFRIVLWLVGFILLVAYTNYLIAVATFLVLVIKLEAGETWKKAILLALCVDLAFFILFELVLQAQL